MVLKEMMINAINCVVSDQDRDCWKAFANVVLNLQVSYAMELAIEFVHNKTKES